jgi:peptidoglycan-associated lipoprotein
MMDRTMKRLNSPLALGLLIGALALAGCESTPESTTGTAGGAGTYGGTSPSQGAPGGAGGGQVGTAPLDSGRLGGPNLTAAGISDTVLFGFDQYDLSADARATLDRQAAWLRQNPQRSITIEGHCDERGTREYNLALGDRRANSVKNYLVTLGIPADRIRTISYGKERPAAIGASEAAWAQNRRAVTVVQ